MKRSWVLQSLVPILLLITLACNGLSLGGGGSSDGVDIEIANRSPDDVCYVLISESTDDNWGNDQLGNNEVIEPGERRTFAMDDGTYDVRVENCDEVAMATAWEISENSRIDVGEDGADVRLLMVNEADVGVCYVYVSPSSGDDWGDDWLGNMEQVVPGAERLFFVESGVYDLQVADCDGDVLTEEYEVDLTEDLVWTLENQ